MDDLELKPGESVWITVNNLSVKVWHADEGVSVTVYGLNEEESESIAETFALFSEGPHPLEQIVNSLEVP